MSGSALAPDMADLPIRRWGAACLPGGHRLRWRALTRAWRELKTLPPTTLVSGGNWYPMSAAEILRELRRAVDDCVNQRAGVVVREPSPARIQRELQRRVRHDCRWCGTPLGRYAAPHLRFCDASYRRSCYG
ncbi:MAG: hypothetical protein ACK54L_18115 [Betaproteobacteria bacterium]